MENCPHYFWEVNVSLMISNIQTIDDFVKTLFADLHSLETKRRR